MEVSCLNGTQLHPNCIPFRQELSSSEYIWEKDVGAEVRRGRKVFPTIPVRFVTHFSCNSSCILTCKGTIPRLNFQGGTGYVVHLQHTAGYKARLAEPAPGVIVEPTARRLPQLQLLLASMILLTQQITRSLGLWCGWTAGNFCRSSTPPGALQPATTT